MSLTRYLIGEYIKVFIAYARDEKVRYFSASGGVVTALLKYLLEEGHVEAVLMPKLRFKHGLAYGVWNIIRDSEEIYKYSGSIYAPTFGFLKILTYALNKFKRIAMTVLPCQAKAVRRLLDLQKPDKDVLLIGLYCGNVPNMLATKYVLKVFNVQIENIESISYRGRGCLVI